MVSGVVFKAHGHKRDVLAAGCALALGRGLLVRARLNDIQVLSHVVLEVILLGLRALVVPVGILVQHQRAAVDKALTHLAGMQPGAVLVSDIGSESGVGPHPFIQLARPGDAYHVAILVLVVKL